MLLIRVLLVVGPLLLSQVACAGSRVEATNSSSNVASEVDSAPSPVESATGTEEPAGAQQAPDSERRISRVYQVPQYRIDQAVRQLGVILGTRPSVIGASTIKVEEETEAVHELIADYLSALR